MNTITMRAALTAALTVGALSATIATASAAAPTATTRGESRVTANSVRLAGTVNPRGLSTSYYFEYGTTRRYGSRTPDQSAGRGTSNRQVVADVGGLQPNTTYQYRIVASNQDGVTSGGNGSFRTRRQPLGLSLAATPNPVTFGQGTTLSGQLTGTGNGGRQVVLEQRGFPFTSGFAAVGNPVVTDANGGFTFASLALPATTQLRARTGNVSSPVTTAAVAVRVVSRVSTTRVRRGRLVRFSGVIRPGREGALFAIQKLGRAGRWVTVAGGITKRGSSTFSGYTRRIRVRRGGQYRVFVRIVDGNYTSGIGRTIRIRTR